jgi:hypothetical protein
MDKQRCAHHYKLESTDEARDRWRDLGYESPSKRSHRKLRGECSKCSDIRYYSPTPGQSFASNRRPNTLRINNYTPREGRL